MSCLPAPPLEIVVHIDRELSIWTVERLPWGSTVAELKAALRCRDEHGDILARGCFGLRLPGGPPVSDTEPLMEDLLELEVFDEEPSPAAAALAPVDGAPHGCERLEEEGVPADSTPQEDSPEKLAVTLRTISGRTERFEGLRPDHTLLHLIERAAKELQLPPRELSLCHGSVALGRAALHEPLAHLGIGPGAELLAVRQTGGGQGSEPVEYRVLQGPLFKKPGEDPAAERVVALTRPVCSKVQTTGRTWTGPSGGQWVELDAWVERPGWLLVEGPGFNQHGPLLERAVLGEEEPIALTVMSPVFNDGTRLKAKEHHLCNICVRPSMTLGEVKSVIALQCPEYRVHKMLLLTLEELGAHCDGFRKHDFSENDLLLSKFLTTHGRTLNLIVFK